MKEPNRDAFKRDVGILFSVVAVLCLVTYCYYLQFYGAVLAAVYGAGAMELFNRTSVGRRVQEFIRPGRNS
jgi:hypothetical protein